MIVEPLQLMVETAFPGAARTLGLPDGPVAAAESRLSVALPEALKDYFVVAGNSREMMQGNFRLLAPEKLRVESDHLIFCEEDQGLEYFGIPVASLAKLAENPNPRVDVRASNSKDWSSEASALSAFMLGVGAFQAILSLPEKARCVLTQKQLRKVAGLFEPVGTPQLRLGGHRTALIDRQNSILATFHYNTDTFYVGSPREDVIEDLETRSGVDFESL